MLPVTHMSTKPGRVKGTDVPPVGPAGPCASRPGARPAVRPPAASRAPRPPRVQGGQPCGGTRGPAAESRRQTRHRLQETRGQSPAQSPAPGEKSQPRAGKALGSGHPATSRGVTRRRDVKQLATLRLHPETPSRSPPNFPRAFAACDTPLVPTRTRKRERLRMQKNEKQLLCPRAASVTTIPQTEGGGPGDRRPQGGSAGSAAQGNALCTRACKRSIGSGRGRVFPQENSGVSRTGHDRGLQAPGRVCKLGALPAFP